MGLPRTTDDSDNNNSSGEENGGVGKKEKKVSCQSCREAKVKCIPSNPVDSSTCRSGLGCDTTAVVGGGACTRCLKLERECFYRTHKRGRKPGKIKLQQILRRLEVLDRTLAEIRELNKEVGDQDADSLIETLSWQLHRSKFFSKGFLDPSSSGLVNLDPEKEARASPASNTAREEGARSGSASGMQSGRVGSLGNGRVGVGRAGSVRGVVEGLGMNASVAKEMGKGRSDFNMLVDLEDHASVARVPDEFATLSNPLKLLAQASSEESERRRHPLASSSLRTESTTSSDEDQPQLASRKRLRPTSPPNPTEVACHQTNTAGAEKRKQDEQQSVVKAKSVRGWAKTYFSRGAFHPVYDNRPEFDPIDQGLMTHRQAERLIGDFYQAFGTFMHIFDPALATITYIRKHSAFLLTVICSLAAEFNAGQSDSRDWRDREEVEKENRELAQRLRNHYEGMITWITSGDYKNVEMAQAFYLLASYRDMSESAMSDQTWLFLGTAIRIATELGCNLVCYSYATPNTSSPDGKETGREHYQRQLRNTERLWLNLWNLEKTLASQTGQRMHLADEGVIATCSRWYRMPLALKQDEALVAQVELRRIMIGCGEAFNTHVLPSLRARRTDGHPSTGEDHVLEAVERDQLSLQLSYFRNSVHIDLKRWQERWLPPQHDHSQSREEREGLPTPLQITGPLSLNYAALVTYALPLPISYWVDVTRELTLLWRDCYISCTDYMATFVDRCQRGFMTYVTNSTVVSTVYAVVFALDLARKAQRTEAGFQAGSGHGEEREVHFGFVSKQRVLSLAQLTAKELDKIGRVRHRARDGGRQRGKSVARKYSVFLFAVLARFGAVSSTSEGDGEGEGEGMETVKRGGFDAGLSRGNGGREEMGGEGRHLRRHHNHPLSHPPSTWAVGAGGGRVVPGTKASHAHSSNLHFSPPSTQHLAGGAGGAAGGWNAPAPSSSTPASTSSTAAWNPLFAQQAGGGAKFLPTPHHHPHQQKHMQDWTENNAAATGASSPATWFNHLTGPPNPNPAGGDATQPGGAIEQDPSWEWMMKDLDFFNVDGGGGGGEPILDQMGRLFG
ncbi:related to LEU3-Zinc-finger transcription factor [Ustilago bromivora]|uniref:Related to LEU3-Zinc-finger transcription factor n=1 Tax=Ustilago bromivora TaxID=307758 RepID=A0A1K0GB79_9BASI|nr:related to LEU3-Zinc-finger transcription factor [Ustilago bromivora]